MGAFLLPAIQGTPQPNVGAGLLAMTAAHSTLMQTEPPLSRASSLPQGNITGSGGALICGTVFEVALVLPAELRRALIAHLMRDLRHAHALDQ
ncbi:hypothetical protein SAMN03159376_02288 [Pseudomonas sp. NFACC09-4]|nr:hypothetical protein SAMN03159376_02288 [Pseudomonas sp. NFACC09-4]SFY00800.1 hypothetical protein SAMN03159390_03390 [Pseudomonas sp. NFACC49-2]SFY12688.1 hypothetical protein SAMN03159309_04146 [Pseudomonas sp. NFACC36]SIS21798.1 hypothetical protein SAMN05428955_3122 [Pseudomonas sp. 7SR1]